MHLETWIEALGATLFCLGGLVMGWRCSTLRGRWWLVGYIVPLPLIGLLGLREYTPAAFADIWRDTGIEIRRKY